MHDVQRDVGFARIVRGMIPRLYAVFFIETMDFLARAGRIGKAQAVLGSMMGIKPFLTLEEGDIVPMEKVRTRQQAIDYMSQHTGSAPETVVSEIERYIVMPGQACAYKIGELKILELREKARQALGEKFDLRQFHNVILKNGAMPLSLLEQVVDRYIRV